MGATHPEAFTTAMNREIAPKGGNFRGVCPIIGRLRGSVCQRRSLRQSDTGQIVPVFLMSRNDTHGTAYRKNLSPYGSRSSKTNRTKCKE